MQVIVHRYKFADGWIRTVDLWCRKQPLFQLRHNHLTYFQLLFKTHFYCLSKLYILHIDKRTSWENAKLVTQNLREWTFEEKKFFFFFLKKEIEKNLKQLKRDFIAADICLNVPIFLYLFLSIFLSFAIFLSFSLSIYLSIYLSIHPSIYPSIYLSIYLSISFSISFVQSHSLFTLFLVLIFSLLLSFAHYEMRTPMTRCSSPAEFRKAAPFIQRKIFYSNCNAIEPTVDSPLHQSLRTHSVPFICRPFSPSLLTWFSQRLVPSRNGLSHIFSRPRIWKKAY